MGIFSVINKVEKPESKEYVKPNAFDYIHKIYDLIRICNISDIDDKLDELFKGLEDGDFYFISWALNHNLVYNKFTRKNIELFTIVNTFLNSREYVYFYTKFMIQNKIKFPGFMAWYKAGIGLEDKKYVDIIKETYKIEDVELADMVDFLKQNGISIRDFCLNMNYLE